MSGEGSAASGQALPNRPRAHTARWRASMAASPLSIMFLELVLPILSSLEHAPTGSSTACTQGARSRPTTAYRYFNYGYATEYKKYLE